MKDNVIWLFGRKVKVVNEGTRTCAGCALVDICEENVVGINECICSTGDNTEQKFIKAD